MACLGHLAVLLPLLTPSSACTYFELPDKADYLIGRTMELGDFGDINDRYQVVKHARGEEYDINVHHLHPQRQRAKYGYVSIDAQAVRWSGLPTMRFDGMNELGLTASALSLRTSVYEEADPSKMRLNIEFFVPWVLASFGKTTEVEAALHNVSVVNGYLPDSFFGFHWAIADAEGRSIVVEYVNGQRRVHRNDVRVLTNDPPYDWQVMNLNTYPFLSPNSIDGNNKDTRVVTEEFGTIPKVLNHGYNLGGLPGDNSPPSRFVRMFYLKQFALKNAPPKTTDDLMVLATGLINNVYLSRGTVALGGKIDTFENTGWATMKMPKSGKFLLRSEKNMQWRLLDLRELDFTTGASFFVENGFRTGVRDDTALLMKRGPTTTVV